MPAQLLLNPRDIPRGLHRGSFTCRVTDYGSLLKDEVLSKPVEIGNLEWKIAVFRGFLNKRPPEMLRIFLLSCNDHGIHAKCSLSVQWPGKDDQSPIEEETKVACPFHSLHRVEIPLSGLAAFKEDASPDSVLTITVALNNIRRATQDELSALQSTMNKIELEVIDEESIRQTLIRESKAATAASTRNQDSFVCSGSQVSIWAQRNPNFRYWLCKRGANGHVALEKCLNEAEFLITFADICEACEKEGCEYVTVFEEKKKTESLLSRSATKFSSSICARTHGKILHTFVIC